MKPAESYTHTHTHTHTSKSLTASGAFVKRLVFGIFAGVVATPAFAASIASTDYVDRVVATLDDTSSTNNVLHKGGTAAAPLPSEERWGNISFKSGDYTSLSMVNNAIGLSGENGIALTAPGGNITMAVHSGGSFFDILQDRINLGAGIFNVMSSQVDFNDAKLIRVATPTAGTDAATKAYVDSTAAAQLGTAVLKTAGSYQMAGNYNITGTLTVPTPVIPSN